VPDQDLGDARAALAHAIEKGKLAEPKPGDDAYLALLRRRLESATNEVSARLSGFQYGTTQGTIPSLLQGIRSRAEAELALIEVQADRVAALQRIVTVATAVDAANESRFKNGFINIQDLMLSHQFLVNCQLAVLDAKTAPPVIGPKLAFPPAPAPAPSETNPMKSKQTREMLIAETMPLLQQMLADESIGEAQPGDDERRKILKERYRAIHRGFAETFRYYHAGGRGSTVDVVFSSPRRLAAAAVALNNTPANRLAVAERTLLISRITEAISEEHFDIGRISIQDRATSQVNRLTAEIALLELRTRFPNVVPLRPSPVAPAKPADGQNAEPEKLRVTDAELAEVYKVFPTSAPGQQKVLTLPAPGHEGEPLSKILPVPPEPGAGDDERLRLLKKRLKWATTELEARASTFEAGTANGLPTDILEALDRYRISALALAKTPAEQLAVEELVALTVRAVTTVTKTRLNAGRIRSWDYWQFVAACAESQIRLLDAKKSVSAPAQTPEKKP
jgi:hypothetical protein